MERPGSYGGITELNQASGMLLGGLTYNSSDKHATHMLHETIDIQMVK